MGEQLSAEYVRKVARLSRLAIADADVARLQRDLSSVVTYFEKLKGMDLAGVEPLTHVGESRNRLAADEPIGVERGLLTNEQVVGLAPERFEAFIKVPKVLGEGGGA